MIFLDGLIVQLSRHVLVGVCVLLTWPVLSLHMHYTVCLLDVDLFKNIYIIFKKKI